MQSGEYEVDETSKQVITYQYAYISGTITLCDKCEARELQKRSEGGLGPVSHGRHAGECDLCRHEPA